MILDYFDKTGAFALFVKRGEADVKELMLSHGLDFSTSKSEEGTACLVTREPYAAVSFFNSATARAQAKLIGLQNEIASSWSPVGHSHIRCPADKELWPFQKADLEYALRRNFTLVGDQPGLGKTPVAICYANEINARRVLVICPANIRSQWVKRIREWTTMRWPYVVYPIFHGRHGTHPTANWTVVSYDLARTEVIGTALAKETYDLLVIDEGHMLKEIGTKRTQAIFGGSLHPMFAPLASRCGAIMVLTGTPLPNRPREAYVLARNLCWDSIDFASEDHFKDRFNPSVRIEGQREDGSWYVYNDERSGRHAELQNRLRANFMVRHLKRDVMTQLKMPAYDIIQLEETGPVKQALAAEKLLDIDPESFVGRDKDVLGQFAIVWHQMGVALAPQVADYVEMLIDGGEEKLVLFGWHIAVLDILQARLEKYGLIRIDGSTGARKQTLVDNFIADPRIKIALGNTLSMGVGTDGLQAVCNHVLVAEPSPVPGDNEQMVDRLDRGGQDKTVQADFFVAPNSIMERILARSLRKLTTIHSALDKQVA